MKTLFAIALVALSFAGATAASAAPHYGQADWVKEALAPKN